MKEAAHRQFALDDGILLRIGELAEAQGIEAYVVGGYVRDRLLGNPCTDIDIVVVGDGIAFAREAARLLGVRNVVTFEKFGTAMIPLPAGKLEFVGVSGFTRTKAAER